MTKATVDDLRVLIVEDDPDVLLGCEQALQLDGMQTIGTGSVEAALRLVAETRPGVIVSDVRLPGRDGLVLLKEMQANDADLPVILITGHGDVPLAVKAMRAGALHFLEKPFEPAELLQTLEEAHQRVSEIAAEEATHAAIEASYRSLTAREQEVMALLTEGMPTKLLATKLGISTRTAEHHRAAVLQKMGARTLSHLARMSMSLQRRSGSIRP